MTKLSQNPSWVEAREIHRAAVEKGLAPVHMTTKDVDVESYLKLYASMSSGTPVYVNGKRILELTKGQLVINTDWSRLFINRHSLHTGLLIVRQENGVAVFTETMVGVPFQLTLDVTSPDLFTEAGDALVFPYNKDISDMVAACMLNPWSAFREHESIIKLYVLATLVEDEPYTSPGTCGLGGEFDPLLQTSQVVTEQVWPSEWNDSAWAIKTVGKPKGKLTLTGERFQRLLAAWDWILKETLKMRGIELVMFLPGFVIGLDEPAEISECGGLTMMLVNPDGLKFTDPLGELILNLRDRAAHIIAHVGRPHHNEVWAREYSFLLSESVKRMSFWKQQLHWLQSSGASRLKGE